MLARESEPARVHILKESPMPSYKEVSRRRSWPTWWLSGGCGSGDRPGSSVRAAGGPVLLAACRRSRPGVVRTILRPTDGAELAHLLRRLLGAAIQPADSDHAGQRQEPRAAMGVPGAVAREVRGLAAGRGRRVYTVQAPNDVVALDAATGRVFWMYRIRRPRGPSVLRAREPRRWPSSTRRCTWPRSTGG